MKHAVKIADDLLEFTVSRNPSSDELSYFLTSQGAQMSFQLAGEGSIRLADRTLNYVAARHLDTIFIHMDGQHFEVEYVSPLQQFSQSDATSSHDVIAAPMPGTVISVLASPGDAIAQGQIIIVIESMKLETSLKAPRDGVVDEIRSLPGSSFDRDAVLVTLQPAD
ncbi:biotin/lipoyl-containing protein [Hyphomonas sp.]|uniref:acetyl-CoA carboxylase biotin carboxyl carrier protein subunit n=1 Tax=Hyphomonas sp. TaxID=87 RepID=UPI003F72BFE9